MQGFRFNEKYLSQIPALQLLISLGYEYLSPGQALKERGGRTANVLLEGILSGQLRKINRIRHKGREFFFSEENIQSAVQMLKNVKYDGLLRTNEAVYDLLILGTALEQTIEGDSRSHNLRYVDWNNWENNRFHVTAEFGMERSRSTESARPDIVLFVNGIPFAVIECKSPKEELEQAVSQMIRNQRDEYIPRLFTYVQLVMATNRNAASYATAGTSSGFWSVWHELRDKGEDVLPFIHKRLSEEVKDNLFSGDFTRARAFFDRIGEKGGREPTEQDRTIYSLIRPERLLELAYKFIVFDAGVKKIARYQQYFIVRNILERIKGFDAEGRRKGGIVWHTQGSGKSLTMVMLTRTLALDPDISLPRIVLVTDRINLDKQLGNTFAACGLDPRRARTGRELLELVAEKRATIVTTLVHKFDKAMKVRRFRDDSPDIFMLVDEGHRTQFGSFAARMRQMFPNACYIGFTGTPLMKKEKNSFARFGGLIKPSYSISQAVKDKAVVPLLYEGRHVEMEQNRNAVDLWFERHTQGLSASQKADLKKKYSRAEMLNKTDQVVYMRAFDISEHFRENWQGTGFKAQLTAPGKRTALKYHAYLNEIGYVSSEVVISAPDSREGYEDIDDEPGDEVVAFWKKMMKRFGSEEEYNKQIINHFKYSEHPEILIVVDKLLTGFDAPRNTVLYLARTLREHTLLQAIARVNRLCTDDGSGAEKEFGFIVDYASVLGELDMALSMYNALEDFDEEDLTDALSSINEEIDKLPQRHSDLWDLFKEVKNQYDEEAYERLLADDGLRDEFYELLSLYAGTLAVSLSSDRFITGMPERKLNQYRNDLKRFQNLKASVKLRYADAVDYRRDYEPRIMKLLNIHITASEVVRLNEPVDIFDEGMFVSLKEDQGIYGRKSAASRADTIAHATRRFVTENMEQDPAFYTKFSNLIQQAIEEFRARRISDLEYLDRITKIRDKVVRREHDDAPEALQDNDHAMAFYGLLKPYFEAFELGEDERSAIVSDAAVAISGIIERHMKVHFWDDADAQKRAANDIDDYLYDEIKGSHGIGLSLEVMDEIIEKSLHLAKNRKLV
jgi:type I restriction enzyme R subunit